MGSSDRAGKFPHIERHEFDLPRTLVARLEDLGLLDSEHKRRECPVWVQKAKEASNPGAMLRCLLEGRKDDEGRLLRGMVTQEHEDAAYPAPKRAPTPAPQKAPPDVERLWRVRKVAPDGWRHRVGKLYGWSDEDVRRVEREEVLFKRGEYQHFEQVKDTVEREHVELLPLEETIEFPQPKVATIEFPQPEVATSQEVAS